MGIEHNQIPSFDHSANNWCLLAGFLKYPGIQSYHLPRAWGSLRYNSNTSTVSQTGIGLHFWKTNRLTHFELLKDLPPKLRKTGRLEALLQRAKWINYSTTLHQLEISGPFGGIPLANLPLETFSCDVTEYFNPIRKSKSRRWLILTMYLQVFHLQNEKPVSQNGLESRVSKWITAYAWHLTPLQTHQITPCSTCSLFSVALLLHTSQPFGVRGRYVQRLGKSMWNGAGERTNLRLEEKHLRRILDLELVATQNEIEHLSVNPMDLSILCNQYANASEMHKRKNFEIYCKSFASFLEVLWRSSGTWKRPYG